MLYIRLMSKDDSINILDVLDRLEEVAGLHVGGLVCIERRGRPWKINRVARRDATTITTASGHTYAALDGTAQFTSLDQRLRPLTRDRAESLLLIAFKKQADRLDLARLTAEQRAALLPAAQTTLEILHAQDRGREPGPPA